MRLRAWREIWMALAVSACGGSAPAWMKQPPVAKVSVFDAPPLATAAYVARVDHEERDAAHLVIERGRFQCKKLFEILQSGRGVVGIEGAEEAQKTCDVETAQLLRDGNGFVFIDGGSGGRWLSGAEVLAAATPIDTPAKALLVVWVYGEHELGWSDGTHYYGGREDGRVRAVPGGFEVAGSTRAGRGCGGSPEHPAIHRTYRVTLFVDTQGTVTVRDRTEISRSESTKECHTHGRRPADFAEMSSGGTALGYLARAIHHEAESVRAFVRIARELRAHGAPLELALAADEAARDERDHAERCAALLGTRPSIETDTLPIRSLRELAIDNATEGCVGESYAALVAVVQARTAASPELRAHFAAIAADELAHAALAHAIAAWLDTVVTTDDRAAIAGARDAALAELEQADDVSSEIAEAFGVPTGAEAHRLAAMVRAVATRRPAPAA